MCIYSYPNIRLLTFSSYCYHCCGKYIGVVLIWVVIYIMMQTKFWLIGALTDLRSERKKESSRLRNCYTCRLLRRLTMLYQCHKSRDIVMRALETWLACYVIYRL